MQRIFIATVAICGAFGIARGQETKLPPLAPELVLVDSIDPEKEQIILARQSSQTVIEPRLRTINVLQGNQIVQQTITEQVQVVRTVKTTKNWWGKNDTTVNQQGKAIATKNVYSTLKVGEPVFYFEGKQVDPIYLKVLPANAFILLHDPSLPDPTVAKAVPATPAEPAKPAAPKVAPGLQLAEAEQAIVAETNAARAKAGLPALQVSPALMSAARGHSNNMAAAGVMSHNLNGRGVGDRVRAAGYAFTGCAENIAMGQFSASDAIRSWLNSAGHRANMLSGTYTQLGVAVSYDRSGRPYWTQVFGRP
ncbi:MAG: CAP domain-containing protein [Zavarzinella sp.]